MDGEARTQGQVNSPTAPQLPQTGVGAKALRSILVMHVWSDRNKGDAAIVAATLALIREIAPGVSIALMSEFSPHDTRCLNETSRTLSEVPGATIVGSVLPVLPIERAESASSLSTRRFPGRRRLIEAGCFLIRSFVLLMVAPRLIRPGRENGTDASTDTSTNTASRSGAVSAPLLAMLLGLTRPELASVSTMAEADIVISKGGGFLFGQPSLRSTVRLYRELFPLFLARRLSRPVVLLGQSVGPFATLAQRVLARLALRGVAWIGVRETISEAAVRRLLGAGTVTRLRLMPDVTVALTPAAPNHPDVARLRHALAKRPRPWIGLTVRRWGSRAPSSDEAGYVSYLDSLAGFCRYIRQTHGGTVFIWPQCTGLDIFEDDRLPGATCYARLTHGTAERLETALALQCA